MEATNLNEMIKIWEPRMRLSAKPLLTDKVIPEGAFKVANNAIYFRYNDPSYDKFARALAFSFVMHDNTKRIEYRHPGEQYPGSARTWTSIEGWCNTKAEEAKLLTPSEFGLVVQFATANIQPKVAFMGKGGKEEQWPEPLRPSMLPRTREGAYRVDGFDWEEIRYKADTSASVVMYFPPMGLRYDGIPLLTSWTDTKNLAAHGIMFSGRGGWRTDNRLGPGYDYVAPMWPITGAIDTIMMRYAKKIGTAKTIKTAPPWATDQKWCLAWQQCMVAAIQPWDPTTFQHGAEKTWVYSDKDVAITCGLYHKISTTSGTVYDRYNSASVAHNADHIDWSQRAVMMRRFVEVHSVTGMEAVHVKMRLRSDPSIGGPFAGPDLEKPK